MVAPVLEKLAEEYKDKINIVKVNVDEPENQAIAMEYWVSWIPNIVFIRAGLQVWEPVVGAYPYEHFKQIIDNLI